MERLSITDYSTKYHISVSTLRRKIKANQIDYSLEDGKYMIRDVPPQSPHGRSDSLDDHSKLLSRDHGDHLDFSTANLLLNELKEAYSTILKDKEGQIVNLKSQISDLQTLIQVLESENQRLKFSLGEE